MPEVVPPPDALGLDPGHVPEVAHAQQNRVVLLQRVANAGHVGGDLAPAPGQTDQNAFPGESKLEPLSFMRLVQWFSITS